MRSGKLNQHVKVQRRNLGKDGRGQDVEAWADHASYWADLQQLTGADAHRQASIVESATWRAELRWHPDQDIRTTDRLMHRGQAFEILAAVNVGGRNEKLLLELREHSDQP